MKTSKVFTAAKRYLVGPSNPRGWNIYICHTLDDAYYEGAITMRDRHRCQRIIEKLLAGTATLSGWLEQTGAVSRTTLQGERAKLQATRHAWLYHLIAHYAALGD